MVIIEKPKWKQENWCSSCHNKNVEAFYLRIKHDECSSNVIVLCEDCLKELSEKINIFFNVNNKKEDKLAKKIEDLKEYLIKFPKLEGFEEHIKFLVDEIEKEIKND